HDIEQLAEIGVALLLFSLGLEVSFRELAPVPTVALAGATLQIVLTIAFGHGIGLAFGWPWPASLWFGALISLSSTMVALKTLQAQGRLGTLSSRVMLGILVVQDLAVVPMMIVLPELSASRGGVIPVVAATARAVVLLGVMLFVSTRSVPRVMAFVARWNSRELFLLSTTTAALGVGYVTWSVALSLALGAFIAGLVITESEYAHQALSDVIPLRDVFGMLFFVSQGMLLDPAQVWQHLGTLAVVLVAVIFGKSAILAAVVRVFGYRNVVPLAVGLTLFQVGEFAFVLARVAGLPVIYGDASQSIVLEAAAISRARAILVTVPAFPDVRSIVTTARQLQPDLAIIARADGREAVQALYALGIEEVTSPEFEAAIEMTRQALIHCNVPAHEILRVASAIRRQRYDLAGGDPESGR